jgi:hypothetical protein
LVTKGGSKFFEKTISKKFLLKIKKENIINKNRYPIYKLVQKKKGKLRKILQNPFLKF